jgi:2-phosphoglycerate kinase
VNDRRPPDSTLIPEAAQPRLEALRQLEIPLLVLIGGATGTGKSTVATEVAHRLGITRVTSTDVVRQTMRAFFSREFMPSIHYSSFEAGPAATVSGKDPDADRNLVGFLEQTRNVLVGVRAVLGRAIEEGYSLALEGVHIVPGMLQPQNGALVCKVLLAIEDEEEHASHFWTRDAASEGLRPFEKYLQALPEIRRIQDYLIEQAAKNDVPVIENSRMEDTVDRVIGLVLDQIEREVAPA